MKYTAHNHIVMFGKQRRIKTEISANDYYTKAEVTDCIDDMSALNEYLYGWHDAIINGMYKKKYVDMYRNR